MNKELIKTISQIVSIILTVASCLVVTIALCVVEIESWSWGMFFIFVMSVAWLTIVICNFERKGKK